MTRQEQKMVKELRGVIDHNLKSVSKLYGFKTVSGCAYKVIDGFLYEVYISAPPIKCYSNQCRSFGKTLCDRRCLLGSVSYAGNCAEETA